MYNWARFDELAIEDRILGICYPVNNGFDTQLCAITPSRQTLNFKALTFIGNWLSFWITNNNRQTKAEVFWLNFAKDVNDLCIKCPNCNRHKTTKRNRVPMHPIYTGETLERVALGIIGPLPRTERRESLHSYSFQPLHQTCQSLPAPRPRSCLGCSRVSKQVPLTI